MYSLLIRRFFYYASVHLQIAIHPAKKPSLLFLAYRMAIEMVGESLAPLPQLPQQQRPPSELLLHLVLELGGLQEEAPLQVDCFS